jgi:hypothetical protein
MSLHCLHTTAGDGTPVIVQTGWDDALGGFALHVEPQDDPAHKQESPYRFSNLDLLPGLPLEKGYVSLHSNLCRMGIKLPAEMLSAVRKDQRLGSRNMRVLWDCDGTVRDIRSW